MECKQIYDNFAIIYRDSPYQLNYYSYDFWADKPGALVRESLFDYFKKNGNFIEIYSDLIGKTPFLEIRAWLSTQPF